MSPSRRRFRAMRKRRRSRQGGSDPDNREMTHHRSDHRRRLVLMLAIFVLASATASCSRIDASREDPTATVDPAALEDRLRLRVDEFWQLRESAQYCCLYDFHTPGLRRRVTRDEFEAAKGFVRYFSHEIVDLEIHEDGAATAEVRYAWQPLRPCFLSLEDSRAPKTHVTDDRWILIEDEWYFDERIPMSEERLYERVQEFWHYRTIGRYCCVYDLLSPESRTVTRDEYESALKGFVDYRDFEIVALEIEEGRATVSIRYSWRPVGCAMEAGGPRESEGDEDWVYVQGDWFYALPQLPSQQRSLE